MGRTLQTYKKLFDSVKKQQFHNVYFLFGQEEFLKKEFVSELIRNGLDERNRAFNLDILYGDEFDKTLFNDRVCSFPLFAERRMVILKNFDGLALANKDYVITSIESIPESLICVVESSLAKLDNARVKKLKTIADKKGLSFNFKFLSEEETVERLRGRLRKEGLEIASDALGLLVESVGTQLIDLQNEVEKITLLSHGQSMVTREIVSQVVGKYRTESVFSFLDLIGARNIDRSLTLLNSLIDGGEEPVFLLAMTIRRVLMLMQVQSLLETDSIRKAGSRSVSDILGGQYSPFLAGILLRQAPLFEKGDLEYYLNNLMWADRKLKTTQVNSRTILEEALVSSHLRKKLATTPN
jgi:DNA polymerase-3 subunit delta